VIAAYYKDPERVLKRVYGNGGDRPSEESDEPFPEKPDSDKETKEERASAEGSEKEMVKQPLTEHEREGEENLDKIEEIPAPPGPPSMQKIPESEQQPEAEEVEVEPQKTAEEGKSDAAD
jgi:hypothetical protein